MIKENSPRETSYIFRLDCGNYHDYTVVDPSTIQTLKTITLNSGMGLSCRDKCKNQTNFRFFQVNDNLCQCQRLNDANEKLQIRRAVGRGAGKIFGYADSCGELFCTDLKGLFKES